MTVHYAGDECRPLCNNAPFREPPLPVTSDLEEVTCRSCRQLLDRPHHLRVVPWPSSPSRPGHYLDACGLEFTNRGMRVYGRVVDINGVEARIQRASAHLSAAWVFTDSSEDLCLDVMQATAFRDALDLFITSATQPSHHHEVS